jgi:hypothetical protein
VGLDLTPRTRMEATLVRLEAEFKEELGREQTKLLKRASRRTL